MNAFSPPTSLLCKLASIVIHTDEILSPDGHAFDRHALQSLLDDAELAEWMEMMDSLALAPKKRSLSNTKDSEREASCSSDCSQS